MINKIPLMIFLLFFILSFYFTYLWMVATLLFAFGAIEFYCDKKTIQVLKQ